MLRTSDPFVWSTVSLFAIIVWYAWSKFKNGSTRSHRPPGPPAWPIVGNTFDFGTKPHQNLMKFKAQYGPVMWLKLGSVNTLVVQSAKAAAELFKNYDLPLSDRHVPDTATAIGYNQTSVAFNKNGTYWRIVRRLYLKELLSKQRVTESASIRRKCIDNMITWIGEDSAASLAKGQSGQIQLNQFLFLMNFNLLGNLVLSRDLAGLNSEEGEQFCTGMHNFMECLGKPNVADMIPCLRWLDPQGLRRKATRSLKQCLEVLKKFLKERVQENKSRNAEETTDFLDRLLAYEGDGKEGPDKLSEKNITMIILEIFLAGSETTSSTLEWAMAELLRNPETMRQVKEELIQVVGHNRKVEESDLDDLPYLDAVVKEIYRLHPVAPLLLSRKANQDANFMGYTIPKNTLIIVNAYAIQRDPDSWEDAESFKPERFLGSNIEYKGQHYELIPFGAGRRICVGYQLAYRVITFALASLLHSFEWKLDTDVTPDTMDMEGSLGITLRKLAPLTAIPIKRNISNMK